MTAFILLKMLEMKKTFSWYLLIPVILILFIGCGLVSDEGEDRNLITFAILDSAQEAISAEVYQIDDHEAIDIKNKVIKRNYDVFILEDQWQITSNCDSQMCVWFTNDVTETSGYFISNPNASCGSSPITVTSLLFFYFSPTMPFKDAEFKIHYTMINSVYTDSVLITADSVPNINLEQEHVLTYEVSVPVKPEIHGLSVDVTCKEAFFILLRINKGKIFLMKNFGFSSQTCGTINKDTVHFAFEFFLMPSNL